MTENATENATGAVAGRPRVCLSMITKNEEHNIGRLLRSLVGHVDCWVVTDTGSTDGTREVVASVLSGQPGPWKITEAPFVNFEQARNAGLEAALASGFEFEYLMLADSDMELVVEDPAWRDALEADAYMMLQYTGSLSYWNTRLVKRAAQPRYRGVTHEFIDLKGQTGRLHGAKFADHASGSSRPNKLPRDEALLMAALDDPATPGDLRVRYMFYLARTLKEAGRYDEAVEWFRRRVAAGGWDEEVWNAQLESARCLRLAGKKGEFPAEALLAYSLRPSRAEPLTELAHFYNAEYKHPAAALFAERAMSLPQPPDLLFVEGDHYGYNPATEFSVAACYMAATPERARGFAVTEALAHDRGAPRHVRETARYNLSFYAPMLKEMAPSFREGAVAFQPEPGWWPTNPSVFRRGREVWAFQRTVDYYILPDGSYKLSPSNVVSTRTFLIKFGPKLLPETVVEVRLPPDLPPPPGPVKSFDGLEDLRGWDAGGQIYCTCVAPELEEDKRRQIVLAKVEEDGQMRDWHVLSPAGAHAAPRSEKNWMPFADGNLPNQFLYSTDPAVVLDDEGRLLCAAPAPWACDHLRGGSQLIEFDSAGNMLGVTHEVTVVNRRRRYLHRFVLYATGEQDGRPTCRPVARTPPFHLTKHGGIEFVAGLCWHPDGKRFIVSYGVEDGESHIGTVDAAEVATMLGARVHFCENPAEEREAA